MKYLNLLRLAIFFPSLLSCTTLPKPELEDKLFPVGNYEQLIDVSITGTRQSYQFNGVVGLTQEGLKLYMMGPMAVTAVKISEVFREREVKIENYFEPLKPYEYAIARFYPVIRSLLLFPKKASEWGDLKVTGRDADGSITNLKGPYGLSIVITEYKGDHPSVFEIRHESFRAQIREMDSEDSGETP